MGSEKRIQNRVSLKDVDLTLASLLFFDFTGGNGNSFTSLLRYGLIVYLLARYFKTCRVVPVPVCLLSLFSAVMALSTFVNTESATWAFSGLMFGFSIIAVMFVFVDSSIRLGWKRTCFRLMAVFASLLVLNDVLMLIFSYDRSLSSTMYFLGNKFIVSYAHCLLSGLMLVCLPRRSLCVRAVIVFGAVMSYVAGSSTGVMIMAVMLAMSFFPNSLKWIVSCSGVLLLLIAVINILIWTPIDIFHNQVLVDFMVNVLHKSPNMTGREKLYAATLGFVAEKPILGWGYLTDIYRVSFGYGNAQNGLFHLITQCGIVGTVLYFSGLFSALKGQTAKKTPLFGLYCYLIAMVFGSSVEINLSFQFAFGVAVLCGALVDVKKGGGEMLIGIMTMHRIPNYGSFLQAYSLKKMIESLGHEVVFVDYHVSPDVDHRRDVAEIARCALRTMKKQMAATSVGCCLKKLRNSDGSSSRSVMFSCDYMLGIDRGYRYKTKCDVLVIGSDEVFNCLQLGPNVGYSLELFGRGAKAKRVVSYAASFGNTTLEKLVAFGVDQEIKSCLSKFDSISVRDSNSSYIVEQLVGEKPEMHLDPVLVGGVESERWPSCNERDYVLLYGYSFRFTEEECQKALDFAHDRNLKLLALGEDQPLRDEYVRCRPDEVLSYFKKATFVITDTFHGTIFSVVGHTPFVTVPRGDKDGRGGNVQKLTTLLEDLGLSERAAMSLDGLDAIAALPIDFDKSDSRRKEQAERSMEYLKQCLSGMNE